MLHALADQLLAFAELLGKPDHAGNGEEFTLSACAAAGWSAMLASIEDALREIASVLARHPRGTLPALAKAVRTYFDAYPTAQEDVARMLMTAYRKEFTTWSTVEEGMRGNTL